MLKRKKNIRMYQVLAITLVLFLVIGFGFSIVKAQGAEDEASILDRVIEILKLTKASDVSEEADNQEVGTALQNGEFVITKKIDFADITTTGADVTNVVTGDFYVDNVIIEMGDFTIASGTQVQISESAGTYGSSTPIFATDVAAFSKNLSMDLNTAVGSATTGNDTYAGYASSTQRVILEDGNKLIIKCTTADCKQTTAAGVLSTTAYLRVTTILKKVNEWSNTYE